MGSFWQQSAFIGHDTGHNGITHNKFIDNMIGIFIGNTTGGVSIAWWKKSHNVHHITCNSIEHDPDIQVRILETFFFLKFYLRDSK